MKKKILICGATGFIGRNIAEALAERDDFEVYGTYLKSAPLADPKISMIRADLTRQEDVKKAVNGMDVIVQAAAATSGVKEAFSRPYYHVTDNAVMNSFIFRSAHEYGVSHVIFFSCTVLYQSSESPVKETDFDANQQMHPNYFGVGWTKAYIEKMCEFYSRLGVTKYTAIRHSNIYGPYDKFDLERSHVFGAAMAKIIRDKTGKITVWGSGDEERDLLYVSDLVNFVGLALDKQKDKFALFNAGCGKLISIENLVKKIILCSGKDIKIEYDLSNPTIKTRVCLDTSKAKKIFGWHPRVSLDEGIRKTMDWYRLNFNI